MDFGIFDHLDRSDLNLTEFYESRLQLAAAYDAAGFHCYHIAEHHFTALGMAPSPSVFLAALAQRTTRLRFGPMVYALPLYHPLRIIEEICMLDQMSGGRLEIGFGRGSSPAELRYYGVDPDAAEALYAQNMKVVMQGLTEPDVLFETKAGYPGPIRLEIRPLQTPHPPIWYGAHSPESAARAARAGLNIINLDPTDLARDCMHAYAESWAASSGAGAALPRIGYGRFVVVAETDAEALALARPAYRRWHESFTYLFQKHDLPQRFARPENFDLLMQAGQGVAGTAETVRQFLQAQMAGTPANYIAGQFAFGDLPQAAIRHSVDLFTRDVMPALRADAVRP